MSRVFTDRNLENWEAFASGGKFGLPDQPKVIFNSLSRPDNRARYVILEGDEAGAEAAVAGMTDERLREMLETARELD